MKLNKQGFMLIEVMLVLLLVSITCCSLLTGYKACVLAMQQYNRLELAFELLEVSGGGRCFSGRAGAVY